MNRQQQMLHAAVDRLVQEQGVYKPVELLLQLSRLAYGDYEAWRCGDLESLEPALAGNPQRVREMLQQAADWARQLGLQAERGDYAGWGLGAGNRLQFSVEGTAGIEDLYATEYLRPTQTPQMDLFFDAGPTLALNELIAALQSRQAQTARSRLQSLLAISPEHRLRRPAELLCDALDDLACATAPPEPRAELEAIEQHLAPAAIAVLGARARDLLAPFWRRLGQAVGDRAFDPQQPRLHASWILAQCLDWPGVCAAIPAAAAAAHPLLRQRLAAAEAKRGNRAQALAQWCRLCWQFPERAAAALADPDEVDTALRSAWLDFESLEIAELESPAWFPAWLLLREPHLAASVEPDLEALPAAPGIAFQCMGALLRAGRTDTSAPQIERRRQLQAANPALFQEFLRQL